MQGRLIKSRVHRLEFPGYMHDFVLTPHFVIALNSSAVFGPGETIVDRMQWKSEQPSQLLVFNKEDFSLTSTIEIPPTFVFHFGNAWEDGGNVHFTACAYENMDIVSIRMRQLAQQRADHQHTAAELLRYSLSLTQELSK